MPGEVAAAGIMAGASLVNGIGGSLLAGHYGHKQHRYNLEIMQRQQDYNLANMQHQYDYWLRQTNYSNALNLQNMGYSQDLARMMYDYQFAKEAEYNSPLAQRERLLAAGYNPYQGIDSNVMQGSPSAAAPSPMIPSTSVPSTSVPTAPSMDIASILNASTNSLSSIVDNVAKLFQTAKTVEERKQVVAQTKYTISQTVAQDLENAVNQMDYIDDNGQKVTLDDGSYLSVQQAQAQGLAGQSLKSVNKIISEIRNTNLDTALKEINRLLQENTFGDNVEMVHQLLEKAKQDVTNTKKQFDLLDAQIGKTQSEQDYIDAQTNKTNEETETIRKIRPYQIRQFKAEINKIYKESELLASQKRYTDAKTTTENQFRTSLNDQIDISNMSNLHILSKVMPEAATFMYQRGMISDKQYEKIFIAAQRARDRELSNQDLKDINYTINNIPFLQYVMDAAGKAGMSLLLK